MDHLKGGGPFILIIKLLFKLIYEENSSSISAEGTKNKVPV